MSFKMLKRARMSLLVAASVCVALVCFGDETNHFPKVTMQLAYPNRTLNRPVWLCSEPGPVHSIFVVEQPGRILILPPKREEDSNMVQVFLDITDRKPYASNEEGLLGLAFHPKFRENGKFYIYYTQQNPKRNVLSEMTVTSEYPRRGDLKTERILLESPKPYDTDPAKAYPNHNGGSLLFGPDGMLYLGLGDGGSGNDPHNNGQSLKTILGKVIRIDVDGRTGDLAYGIPKDNPFAGKGGGVREEIWAYGLRNPWRMSFDRETGELWAGDVGQNKWEEVDVIVKGGNYGWRIREGFHAFDTNAPPAQVELIEPVFEYGRMLGNSMTGGFVYRGKKLPALRGLYLCADFTTGTIFAIRREQGKVVESGVLLKQPRGLLPLPNIASFGEDADGELYIL
ncbi:MAG TPA: PQQ-dependent sugar dehydrogenase, partial [Verrucomicrobiae bacterium]